MRYFDLLNFQHVVAYVFPTLVFMVLFWLGLSYGHLRGKDDQRRKSLIVHRYPDGIERKNEPMPLVMVLILIGTVAWAVFYILDMGLRGIKI